MSIRGGALVLMSLLSSGCQEWNNPYVDVPPHAAVLHGSFAEQPKTLDPAEAYTSHAYRFMAQIYEPPLQYHYLKRPLTLVPLTASALPQVDFLDKSHHVVAKASQAAYTRYRISIKPGILFQPHPAFAQDESGRYLYHSLDATGRTELTDFPQSGTRELVAADYVYQIKRLAHPKIHSPILGLMSQYILGLKSLNQQLTALDVQGQSIDLRQHHITGVELINEYTYDIILDGYYPSFMYWLAMPFFAPMPWEADVFYAQPGMQDHNISLDVYPIGTGAFMIEKNDPNHAIILTKNPNFRDVYFPTVASDQSPALQALSGRKLPLIDRAIYSLEKESIPRWSKFLQGYYDVSTISSDGFDEAIRIDGRGQAELTHEMMAQNIQLHTSVEPTVFYMGFNMLDPVVGGMSQRALLLRRAISIAIDYEEFMTVFLNGRGVIAHHPIPPHIGSFDQMFNPYVYQPSSWHRRSIAEAKAMLAQAGYRNGIDPDTNQPLMIHYDVPSQGDPNEKSRLNWLRKQFKKINIDLNIRTAQYNRFQEKIRQGSVQIFSSGWHADYPDPENFLFLLYGPNGKVQHGGENSSNYQSDAFDGWFNAMNQSEDTNQKKQFIKKMIQQVQHDAPWIFGYHPKIFSLYHHWYGPIKSDSMINNRLKYIPIDPKQRAIARSAWNQPALWPLIGMIWMVLMVCFGLYRYYMQLERTPRYR